MRRGPWGLITVAAALAVLILATGVSTAVAGGSPLFLRIAGVRQSELDEMAASACNAVAAGIHTNHTEGERSSSSDDKSESKPTPRTTTSPTAKSSPAARTSEKPESTEHESGDHPSAKPSVRPPAGSCH